MIEQRGHGKVKKSQKNGRRRRRGKDIQGRRQRVDGKTGRRSGHLGEKPEAVTGDKVRSDRDK